jgi:hypothetical protein
MQLIDVTPAIPFLPPTARASHLSGTISDDVRQSCNPECNALPVPSTNHFSHLTSHLEVAFSCGSIVGEGSSSFLVGLQVALTLRKRFQRERRRFS